MNDHPPPTPDGVLAQAQALRWKIGPDVHERFVEAIYAEAARLADRAVTLPGGKPRFDLDRAIDRGGDQPGMGYSVDASAVHGGLLDYGQRLERCPRAG
jgi:hypothetical protein